MLGDTWPGTRPGNSPPCPKETPVNRSIFAIVALLALSCGTEPEPDPGDIEGEVIVCIGYTCLKADRNLKATLDVGRTATVSAGFFRFSGVAPGEHTIWVEPDFVTDCYWTFPNQAVIVKSNETTEVTITGEVDC